MLCSKVSEELAHEYGGPQKFPWSAVLIKGMVYIVIYGICNCNAQWIYFKTL